MNRMLYSRMLEVIDLLKRDALLEENEPAESAFRTMVRKYLVKVTGCIGGKIQHNIEPCQGEEILTISWEQIEKSEAPLIKRLRTFYNATLELAKGEVCSVEALPPPYPLRQVIVNIEALKEQE